MAAFLSSSIQCIGIGIVEMSGRKFERLEETTEKWNGRNVFNFNFSFKNGWEWWKDEGKRWNIAGKNYRDSYNFLIDTLS